MIVAEDVIRLWFDVGIKRYTTCTVAEHLAIMLWFDVGIKRYTTFLLSPILSLGCGLM